MEPTNGARHVRLVRAQIQRYVRCLRVGHRSCSRRQFITGTTQNERRSTSGRLAALKVIRRTCSYLTAAASARTAVTNRPRNEECQRRRQTTRR